MRGVVVQSLVLLCFVARADISSNPAAKYQDIQQRNIFGLKTPAPPAEAQEPAQTNMPKLSLNGITTILGKKQALLKLTPADPRSGEEPESLILTEGERQGAVQVVAINEQNGTVRVVNSGTPMTLTFEETPSTPATNAVVKGAGSTPAQVATNAMTGLPTSPGHSRRFPPRFSRQHATNAPPAPPPAIQTPPDQITPEERETLSQIEAIARENSQSSTSPPPTGSTQQYQYQQQPPFTPQHRPVLPQ